MQKKKLPSEYRGISYTSAYIWLIIEPNVNSLISKMIEWV